MEPRRFSRSVRFAWRGLAYAFGTQPHMRLHLLLGVAAVIAAWWLRGSALEQLLVWLAVGLVLFAELLNTALEVLVDLVSPSLHEKAAIAKDVAASAVMVCALCALIVAGMLLWSRLGPR